MGLTGLPEINIDIKKFSPTKSPISPTPGGKTNEINGLIFDNSGCCGEKIWLKGP
tara:strand:- start:476 stop:640 length:165 start_codon:yes stop_codon:yes gene_type:complete